MRRILYIVSTLQKSGPTNQLYNLLKYIDRSQFEPHLITLSSEPTNSRWVDYEDLDVKLHSLQFSRIAGLVLAKSSLARFVNQIQPDLIHSQGIRSDVLSARLQLNIPRICTIRNIPQHDYLMSYGLLLSRLMVRQHVSAMNKLDMCVAVSESVSKNLQQALLVQRVITIQNGVETEVYCPVTSEEKLGLRRALALPTEASLWISSGDLSVRKDPLFLISAWKQIFDKDPAQHLVFIGGGPLEAECRIAVKDCQNIHILGRVNNVVTYLRACDYFISASKSEGLPNAVMEAMGCGLPVLLSDIGPHREIWKMASESGTLFPVGSQDGFIGSLRTVANISRSSMSSAASSLVTKHFNASKMSHSYQELYNSLVSNT